MLRLRCRQRIPAPLRDANAIQWCLFFSQVRLKQMAAENKYTAAAALSAGGRLLLREEAESLSSQPSAGAPAPGMELHPNPAAASRQLRVD